jgi:large conductance mechanosensitive channel
LFNVIELRVVFGVIIGVVFGKSVDWVVNDLIMPIIGRIVGKVDFTNLFVPLSDIPPGTPQTLDALKKAGVPVFAYGSFITILINFIILAVIVFLIVKQMNRLKKQTPPAPAAPPEDVLLLREIRDALKAR